MIDGIIALIAGVLLLFFGKRLFWLAAALVAFLFGWQLFGDLLGPGWSLVLAVVLGIVFAWLAIKFIRFAAYIIGFLAGASALPLLVGAFGVDMRGLILAGIGGALGLILVAVAFDWGLSLITAWAGASAVVFGLQKWMELGDSLVATIIFFALLILGVGWQASRRRKN
ncbi:hypothetical protein ACFLY4_09840 [Chloroflexota bacterium]